MSGITLNRVDPENNLARFYFMDVSPTLFGDWVLLREWGRIGQSGQKRWDWFTDEKAALSALQGIQKQKERKGYSAA